MMNEANIEMNDKNEGKKEEIGSGLRRDWSELNKECLIDILSRLSLEERWKVSMAKVASNCHKLRELDISEAFNISQKALKMVERSCKNVKIIMEPPSNVRLSQDEARNYGLSVRSIDTRELFEHISQLNTNDS